MIGTLKPKTEITVPKSIRRKAGIKAGDQFEFSVSGRVITILPKQPSGDEYTSAQRRVVDEVGHIFIVDAGLESESAAPARW